METNYANQKRNLSFQYFIAAIFIGIGFLMIGKNVGYIGEELYHALLSWPMLLVVFGIRWLFSRHYVGGGVLLAAGIYFILPKLGCVDYHLTGEVFWPTFFIAMGLVFLFTAKRSIGKWSRKREFSSNDAYSSNDGFVHSENVFGSVQRIVMEEKFKGAVIKNSFGGTVLDLRRTTLAEEQVVVDIDCNFGGVEIYAPSNWNIRVEVHPFVGGCEDTRLTVLDIDTTRALILRGRVSFGGIEVKN